MSSGSMGGGGDRCKNHIPLDILSMDFQIIRFEVII